MNEDELRRFLDQAKPEQSEGGGAPSPTPSEATARADQDEPALSFDELIAQSPDTPAPQNGTPQRAARSGSSPESAAAGVPFGAGATASPGEEELIPLVLPGLEPEPRDQQPLPPVFSPQPSVEPAQPTRRAEARKPILDPAPTEPYQIPEASQGTPTQPYQIPAGERDRQPGVPLTPPPAPAPEDNSELHALLSDAQVASAQTAPTFTQAATTEPTAVLASAPAPEPSYERISVTGGKRKSRRALPWLIVGGGAVVAAVAAILVVNLAGVPTTPGDATTTPTETTAPPTSEEPTETTEPSAEPSEEPDSAPEVDIGENPYALEISQWQITVDRSNRFGGSTPYALTDGDSRAMFELPLAESLSDSCSAARTGWGLQKNDDGTLEVVRPEPRCTDADDAAVYDTIWGLMDAMAKSARSS